MKTSLIAKIVVYALVALFLIGVLVFGLSTGFGFGSLFEKDEGGAGKESYTYTSPGDITELDVSWVSGDITIQRVSGDEIKITESSSRKLKESEKLILENEGDRLTVKWSDKSFFAGFSLFNTKSKKLVLEIPETTQLEKLTVYAVNSGIDAQDQTAAVMKLETASGAVEGKNLIAQELGVKSVSGGISLQEILCKKGKVESTSGKIEAEGLTADDLKASTVSGGIDIVGDLGEVQANSVSGGIEVATGLMPEKAAVNAVSGSVTLVLPENDGFVFEKSTVSGSFGSKTFPLETFDKRTYYKDKNAENTVKLGTTSGGMKLEKGAASEKVKTYDDWTTQKEKADSKEEETESKEE